MISIGAVASAWTAWFHASEPPYTIALFRILFGLLLVANAALFARDASLWIGPSGLLSHDYYQRVYGRSRFTVLAYLPPTERWLHAVIALHLCSAVLLALGLFTRTSATLAFVTLLSIQQRNPVLVYGADDVLRLMCLLLIFSRAGEALSIDEWLARRAGAVVVPGTAWCTRLMQLQVSICYLSAFLHKFSGESWINGTAAYYAVQVADFRRRPLPRFARTLFWARVGTYSTVATEGALGFGLWISELRYPLLLLGVAMHLVMDWFMNLQLFSVAMILCLLLFVDPADVARLLQWMGVLSP
ncbi:MAG: HTTM domain-containing protein [Vicinamibacterales bacterium]